LLLKIKTIYVSKEISPWTGRFYSLLDPSYAKNNIPIIASVSEHQPTSWSSFYFDLQMLMIMFPGEKLANLKDINSFHENNFFFFQSWNLLLLQKPV